MNYEVSYKNPTTYDIASHYKREYSNSPSEKGVLFEFRTRIHQSVKYEF
jgi:hypothetical protein